MKNKEAIDKIKNSKKKWFYLALTVVTVVGLICFIAGFISEKAAYNNALDEYKNHEHSSSCYEETLDCNSSSYWHIHNSYCYKEELNCIFSTSSAEWYAGRYSDFESLQYYFIIFIAAISVIFLCIRFSHLFKKWFEKIFKNFNSGFDETDGKWIVWLKRYIKAWFVAEILGSIVASIYFLIDWGNPMPLLIVPSGILVALLNKCINMILLQYLNNINSIRINTEMLATKYEEKPAEAEENSAEVEENLTENEDA